MMLTAKDRINKLHVLLARVQKRADEPRPVSIATVSPPAATVPPSADARAAIAKEITNTPVPSPVVAKSPINKPISSLPPAAGHSPVEPLESGAQLVGSRPPMATEAEEVIELDEPQLMTSASEVATPPSSRRPKPMSGTDEVDEMLQASHTPPPESGPQIAAQEIDFEEDLTGVREASRRSEPVNETPISLQPIAMPEPKPPVRHSMEMEIPTIVTRPPQVSEPPAPAASQVQVVQPAPASGEVAVFSGSAPSFAPRNFGELLDSALSL